MHSFTNLPYTGISSFFFATTSYSKSLGFNTSYRKININSTNTRNTTFKTASSSSWITEFDLYDLLGIDSSSDQSQIKSAYRTLQKRCHPDIAGPNGHDMAIILNQAYSVLSDPNSRFVYDKEQSKISELRGYTGKPLYSVWYGSDSENRAVFVDEVKCIGCLKCALLAEKTFAVESVYGRARVVSQWADSESKIQEAIDACPVDCISMVERSNLAALEFLMSKQPRGNVRVGASNAVGARVSNIFVDVTKFQTRFQDSMDKKASSTQSTEPEERDARSVAIQTIRSISNWLYWQQPNSNSEINTSLTITGRKIYSQPKNINKLREAVAARKRDMENGIPIQSSKDINKEEYWVPSALVLPEAKGEVNNSEENVTESGTYTEKYNTTITNKGVDYYEVKKQRKKRNSFWQGFMPLVAATIAGTIIHQQIEQESVTRLEEHIGGSMALGIVNSSWSQIILAGLTWYLITMYVIELIQAFINKIKVDKK